MQQIYRRRPVPKCDFSKAALELSWNRTLAWVFSCKFAACFSVSLSLVLSPANSASDKSQNKIVSMYF